MKTFANCGNIDNSNEALRLESLKPRTCAKDLHSAHVGLYAGSGRLHADLTSYRW